jgi:hypothetical protein
MRSIQFQIPSHCLGVSYCILRRNYNNETILNGKYIKYMCTFTDFIISFI